MTQLAGGLGVSDPGGSPITIGTLVAGRVVYATGPAAIGTSGSFLWDDTTKALSLPTLINPAQTLTTTGTDNAVAVTSSFVRFNNATDLTVGGIAAGVDGQVVTFSSIGAGHVFFDHQDTNAAATDRLINRVTSGPTPIAAGKGSATYRYDGTTGRWRLIHHNQGDFISIAFDANNFGGNVSMTWTLTSGDVIADRYMIVEKTIVWSFRYNNTTVGGTPSGTLFKIIPSTYTFPGSGFEAIGYALDNGTATPILCFNSTTQRIGFSKIPSANWTASTDNTRVSGTIQTPID